MGRKPPRWTEEEKEYLSESYGRISVKTICNHLHRSRNAIKIAAYRKLNKMNQRSNIYTARAVAQVLGVSDSKTIISWMEKGYIKGQRASFSYGKYRVWRFEFEDIEACLRARPWLVKIDRMECHYFRSVVREEYDKDPWYTAQEAAKLLGLLDYNAVHRYIYRGWLPAVKKPGGPWQGVWVIRKSAIDYFSRNDPRREYSRRSLIRSRRRTRLDAGCPVPIMKEWLFRCPVCRHQVRIHAEPNMRSHRIKELFIKLYATGSCSHGRKVMMALNDADSQRGQPSGWSARDSGGF